MGKFRYDPGGVVTLRKSIVISCSYTFSVGVKNGNTQYNIYDINY